MECLEAVLSCLAAVAGAAIVSVWNGSDWLQPSCMSLLCDELIRSLNPSALTATSRLFAGGALRSLRSKTGAVEWTGQRVTSGSVANRVPAGAASLVMALAQRQCVCEWCRCSEYSKPAVVNPWRVVPLGAM